MADARISLRGKQQRWLKERRADLDRKDARLAVGASDGDLDARMLDKLTERITERLQLEVRRETAQAMQKGDVGGQVERFLENHLATNTCPICFELMTGKQQAPMLLFPCGHTFCACCLNKHLSHRAAGTSTCPFCRACITSHAVNVSLQQVIDGFVEKQRRLERGDDVFGQALYSGGPAAGAAAGAALSELEKYTQQYRAFSLRCTVLENQLDEATKEAAVARERGATASVVLAHLRTGEEAVAERLRKAQAELDVAREQRREQEAKCDAQREREAQLLQQAALIQRTLGPLTLERDKAKLLARSFSPDVAARLDVDG